MPQSSYGSVYVSALQVNKVLDLDHDDEYQVVHCKDAVQGQILLAGNESLGIAPIIHPLPLHLFFLGVAHDNS